MASITLRNAEPADFAAAVSLNATEVRHTSPMDEARLRRLDGISDYHKVVTVGEEVAAFLFAMRNGCGYANENFEWFASRYATFLYVDRIVVGSGFQGLKLGTLLYNDLFDWARSRDIMIIACEYNRVPPNEPSRLLHDRFGFREVGRQWLGNGFKQVSLQVAEV